MSSLKPSDDSGSATCARTLNFPSKNAVPAVRYGASLYATARALSFDIHYKHLLEEFENRGAVLRLLEARVRVSEIAKKMELKKIPEEFVIDEVTGQPYYEHTYRHVFAEVRDLAIRGGDVSRVEACPSLAFVNETTGESDKKHDRDLRDTCVMLLDRAGNDLLSICDVTGHSYRSGQLIMTHYRARNPARADAAIDRLVAFLGREGPS